MAHVKTKILSSSGNTDRKMDESWRMRMGMPAVKPSLPRRRSTEETSRRTVLTESEPLDPEDFKDVFGGPPRSVLYRQFSGGSDFARPNLFYEEVFRQPEVAGPAKSGRNLPEFRIPVSRGGRRSEEFYSDIFGKDVEDLRRSTSRSKSKTNSSSVLSSEDLSPFRPAVADDDVSFASFASKLRPINVPPKWNSVTMKHDVQPRQQEVQHANSRCSYLDTHFADSEYIENLRNSGFGLPGRPSSPETSNVEHMSFKVSAVDLELNSPSSSMVSSLCQDQEAKIRKIDGQDWKEQEEDEVMSSYVIEINSDSRSEGLSVDEAIAWAKAKFQMQGEDCTEVEEKHEGRMRVYGLVQSPVDKKQWNTEEEKQQLEKDIEMELLGEDIKLWSSGKEANIQLLLSTLHHIMWPNSGWNQISITNLKENSNLKKAYQKARLCLHPDKLQQRGATLEQKYVAEKAFPILQDAWAAYISQEASVL